MRKPDLAFWSITIISACLYAYLGYWVERYEHTELIVSYIILFAAYLVSSRYSIKISFRNLFIASVVIRLVLLFAIPALSDDVFRFIWDGRLWISGIHPFEYLPDELMAMDGELPSGINHELYLLLNSKDHYTIYPPVGQLVFLIAAAISPTSILGATIVIRIFILACEVLTILLAGKLLSKNGSNRNLVYLYALNPLVVMELTGNLHFEAAWITAMACFFLYLRKGKTISAGISFALGIASKLVPLMFAPVVFRYLTGRKFLIFCAVSGLTLLLLFAPLFDKTLFIGMYDSLDLYFRKFEFNASFYYVVRFIGYQTKGYNIIQTAGPALAQLTIVFILFYSLLIDPKKTSLPQSMMWILFWYILFSTTVHPWYIVPMVFFSMFTNYRYPIYWSFLIFFTYLGYSQQGYLEVQWVVFIEYTVVLLIAAIEIRRSGYFLELYNKVRSRSM